MDVSDNKSTNKAEALMTMPIGLSPVAGTDGPWPVDLIMPVIGKPEAEWPTARFWLARVIDFELLAEMKDAGVDVDLGADDPIDQIVMNEFMLPRILSREKAWENLIRADGSEWVYVPPQNGDELTQRDARVRLGVDAWQIGIVLKAKAFQLWNGLVIAEEGNSETSSQPATEESAPKKKRPTAKRAKRSSS